MNRNRATVVVCITAFICMVFFVVCYADLRGRYKEDKTYAFMCVEQNEYHDLQNEEHVKGTYLVEDNLTIEADSIHKKTDATLLTVDFSPEDILGGGSRVCSAGYGRLHVE